MLFKRRIPIEVIARLYEEDHKPDRMQMLMACVTDVERHKLCLQWAEESRAEWFLGRRQTIRDVLLSKSQRYRHFTPTQRVIIGKQLWMVSSTAKGIVGDEQMFTRWAESYKGTQRG